MRPIKTSEELKEAISELRVRQADEKRALREELSLFKENMRPANLLKKAVAEVSSTEGLRTNVITGIVGLAAGYLAKKAVFKNPEGSSLQKFAGNILQMAVAGGAPALRNVLMNLLKGILERREERKKQEIARKVQAREQEPLLTGE